MKKAKYAITLLFIFVLAQIVGADEVKKTGKDRYETGIIELTSPVASDKIVSISSAVNLSGRLAITTTDADQAVFVYSKLLKVSSESEAVDYAGMINVVLEKTSTGVNLLLQAPNPAPWSGTDNSGIVAGELQIPKDSRIEIDARYFDLEITGPFRAVESKSSFGQTKVANITEFLYLATSNRDIIVNNISGEINLTTSHADIEMNNLVTAGQPAFIRNENGSITGENLSGVFDIKNSYGRIRLSDLSLVSERSRISGSYSPINLRIIRINNAGLTVRNTNEDIKLFVPESLAAEFSLRVDTNGEIDVEGLEIRPTLAENSRLDFESGAGGPRVRMSIRGDGNISVRGN